MNKTGYKFNGGRYMTCGIEREIPFELQVLMWSMIDENIQNGLKMDYLQIFDLNVVLVESVRRQKIVHRQEQPRRKAEIIVNLPLVGFEPISLKVYVIDDIDHCTMLLANEY